MRKKTSVGLFGLGVVGVGLYTMRRYLISKVLKLGPHRFTVAVSHNLKIPMPDGIHLAADHYYPRASHLFPTIIIRTPYGRNTSSSLSGMVPGFVAQRLAERGYNVIVQDVRGRFDSEGEFFPFVNEAADGKATLMWVQDQTWFNGLLGMWGQSYLGFVQWAVAGGAPLYLKALAPALTGTQMALGSMRDGVSSLDTILRWMMHLDVMAHDGRLQNFFRLARLTPRFQERILQRGFQHLPLNTADQVILGKPLPFYQEWMQHAAQDDPYWQQLDYKSSLSNVKASVHLFTGWYDLYLRETLEDYQLLHAGKRKPYLTIGPWYHGDVDGFQEHLRESIVWFDATLKGDRRGLRTHPVRIYVMGRGEWRDLDQWPPPTELHRLDLADRGRLLSEPLMEVQPPDRYRYDPADPTPHAGGYLLGGTAGRQDNSRIEARPDVLTYTSPVLEQDLEVIGVVRVVLYVRSSNVYTDFLARLCEVFPDGRSLNVTEGILRLRPGVGEHQPDGSLQISIDLWPTASCFLKGSALRLQVASGAHPRWNRNLGTGESTVSTTEMRPADQSLYHDSDHPSHLILPVAPPAG
jgi:putative CocE/NonD family hydrolase